MGQDRRRVLLDDARLPWAVAGFGVALLAAATAVTGTLVVLDFARAVSEGVVVGYVTTVPFTAGVIVGGYWLARSDVEPTRYRRVAKWCFGGATVFLVMNAVLAATVRPGGAGLIAGWLLGSTSWGAAGGLLVGVVEARAIQHAIEAERRDVRAASLDEQREALDYLNGLLRHEVLNTAQVIKGYTTMLLEDGIGDEEQRAKLEAIQRQSDDMTTVVDDIRLMGEALHEGADLRPVDLSAVLQAELQDLRDTYPDVRTEVAVATDLVVRADAFLPRVFSNLLSNAVEYNDADAPRVTVAAERDGDVAVVRVSDDGSGIPRDERDGIFERDDLSRAEHGLGLYLVDRLVDRYDGRVELTETGPSGSTFTVELPLTTDEVTESVP